MSVSYCAPGQTASVRSCSRAASRGKGVTLSVEEIREVLKLFIDSELQDLRLEVGDVRLAVSKNSTVGSFTQPSIAPAVVKTGGTPTTLLETTDTVSASPPPPSNVSAREDWVAITSPSVGVFYRRPSPDQPSFVEVGSVVAAGDPVCLIEVMKMFAGVTAPSAGRIAEIAVADATMVEYGQPLMYIEPA
jgi:acetyl-CoA carboxylase biotin carboxyl carrier protein